jgi:hypothetical protein
MSLLAAIRKGKMRGLKPVLSILLLTFYITGNAHFESLHQLLHHHRGLAVSHTASEEKDPCHRSIYHDDATNGCGHKSHIIVSHKCDLCDSIFHHDQIAGFLDLPIASDDPAIVDSSLPARTASTPSLILPSRAPPVI